MKKAKTISLITLVLLRLTCYPQQFSVSVNNGYGSGLYEQGETVYVFSRETAENEIFVEWEIGTPLEFINDEGEWRFSFVMPPEDITITAVFDELPEDFVVYEEIQGVNILKPVFSAIVEESKGTVFLFHGTGGSAAGWIGINKDQNYTLLKDLFYNGYSVIVTECEESTLGTDTNGDGKIRWFTFPIDTVNNVDYANIKAIIDTFDNRGLIDRNKLFSIGMSAGGAYSTAFSVAFSSIASVTYCASGQAAVIEATNSPILFCMMPNDEVIGQEGNDDAVTNYNILLDREICTGYFMNYAFPVYPQYFMRVGLSQSESEAVCNELNTNGFLDLDNFLTGTDIDIQSHIQSNPQLWTGFNALTGLQKVAVANLVGVAYGSHNFYSNHNKRTIDFFDNLCETPVFNNEFIANNNFVKIYPNPASNLIFIDTDLIDYEIQIINLSGQVLLSDRNTRKINISGFAEGVYLVRIKSRERVETIRLLVL
ncbi:MAG: T9SS type A sorting domain-containing protein [Bacteroidales bacterium]|nr:T9SS type A sorting domain-containing protein [Bacteroidales bacterium]